MAIAVLIVSIVGFSMKETNGVKRFMEIADMMKLRSSKNKQYVHSLVTTVSRPTPIQRARKKEKDRTKTKYQSPSAKSCHSTYAEQRRRSVHEVRRNVVRRYAI
jgi:ABC-type oligopeptide transport system ATPase subunit